MSGADSVLGLETHVKSWFSSTVEREARGVSVNELGVRAQELVECSQAS